MKGKSAAETPLDQRSLLQRFAVYMRKYWFIYLLVLPGLICMIVFNYGTMYGIQLAFKDYSPRLGVWGSPWVGFEHFREMIADPNFIRAFKNTVIINVYKLLFGFTFNVFLALLINEMKIRRVKSVVQTCVYLPYFLSWVVVSFMAFSLFSVDDGLFNHLLAYFGFRGVDWYSDPGKWPFILTFFQIWKTIGYSTVMYISTLTGIPNDYYEAAVIDGATKWQQIRRITLPCLKSMMIVLTILAIGRIFYADFGLFFQLPRDSGPLYQATQVIDTYVYRALKETGNVGMAAAASLYQSIVGFVLVVGANLVVRRIEPDSALF